MKTYSMEGRDQVGTGLFWAWDPSVCLHCADLFSAAHWDCSEKVCTEETLEERLQRKSLLSRNNALPTLETLKETQQCFKGCYLTSSLARPLSAGWVSSEVSKSPCLSPLVSANHSPEILMPTGLISMAAWRLLLLARKSFSVDALLSQDIWCGFMDFWKRHPTCPELSSVESSLVICYGLKPPWSHFLL